MKNLYIITNNKVANKGKLARACATVGGYNGKRTLLSKVVVLKGGDEFYSLMKKYKISGVHIDAGCTQVKPFTVLAFGVYAEEDETLRALKLL